MFPQHEHEKGEILVFPDDILQTSIRMAIYFLMDFYQLLGYFGPVCIQP